MTFLFGITSLSVAPRIGLAIAGFLTLAAGAVSTTRVGGPDA